MSKRLTTEDIARAADELGCEMAQILAVIDVETAGKSGFLDDGRPRILFEGHVFYRRTDGRYGEREPISSRAWGAWGYGTYTEQWRRFEMAAELDRTAAIESCSWGLFQILGENWPSLGYATAEAFYRAMHRDEAAHLDAFTRYIRANGLEPSLRAGDSTPDSWVAFARRYNGPAFASHGYHERVAAAYARHAVRQPEPVEAEPEPLPEPPSQPKGKGMFAHIRKLIVALVGIALLLVHQHFGLDLSDHAETIVAVIIGLGTAWGVWAVPNEPG